MGILHNDVLAASQPLTPVDRDEVLFGQYPVELLGCDLLDAGLVSRGRGRGRGGRLPRGGGGEQQHCRQNDRPPSHAEGARGLTAARPAPAHRLVRAAFAPRMRTTTTPLLIHPIPDAASRLTVQVL